MEHPIYSFIIEFHFNHYLVFCDIGVGKMGRPVTEKVFRSFANFCYDDFSRDLNSIEWSGVLDFSDINEKVRFFSNRITELFNIHAPLRRMRFTRPAAPWLTWTVREMMRLRDRALTRYRRTGAEAHGRYYRDLRNMTRTAVTREKKAYLEFCSQNKSPKETWNSLKSLGIAGGGESSIPPELGDAESINRGFLSSVSSPGINIDTLDYYRNHLMPTVVGAASFDFVPARGSEVSSALFSIKSNAIGDDGINIKMLRMCAPTIMPWLTHIINSCLEELVFPECWKLSVVIPLPKKSKPETIADLRPISILPALSKVLEKIVAKQLNDYLKCYRILPEVQSGFRSGYSCATALTSVVDDVVGARDRGFEWCGCCLRGHGEEPWHPRGPDPAFPRPCDCCSAASFCQLEVIVLS